jgi:hypothetical protein
MSAESEFKEAVELGKRVLGRITKNNHAPPSFLPQARGLLFYSTTRVGLGIGVEQGRGFVISRWEKHSPSKVSTKKNNACLTRSLSFFFQTCF